MSSKALAREIFVPLPSRPARRSILHSAFFLPAHPPVPARSARIPRNEFKRVN